MPSQPVDHPSPLCDQLIAIVLQQADLHRPLIQERDREPLDTLAQRRSRDRGRIDHIRLPRLRAQPAERQPSSPAAPAAPAPRPRPDPLEPRDHVPAILERPHALVTETRSEPKRLERSLISRRHGPLRDQRTTHRINSSQRMRPLVRVHPDHDHVHVPSLKWSTERISGGHTSVGAMPRSLSVHDLRRKPRGLVV